MAEGADVEIAAELAVDPKQNVQIEGTLTPRGSSWAREQIALGLDEIRAHDKAVAADERFSDMPQQLLCALIVSNCRYWSRGRARACGHLRAAARSDRVPSSNVASWVTTVRFVEADNVYAARASAVADTSINARSTPPRCRRGAFAASDRRLVRARRFGSDPAETRESRPGDWTAGGSPRE